RDFHVTGVQTCALPISAGLSPKQLVDLSALTDVGSTGAPLPEEGFEWVYESVSPNVLLGSVSGGTDLCTAFVLSCPLLDVHAGRSEERRVGEACGCRGW